MINIRPVKTAEIPATEISELQNQFKNFSTNLDEQVKNNEPVISMCTSLRADPGNAKGHDLGLKEKPDLKLLVIGSSIIRGIDAEKIEKYSTAITECMPGAKIEHLMGKINSFKNTHTTLETSSYI